MNIGAELNHPITDFNITVEPSEITNFSQLHGTALILYFYPKDNTSGCTLESQEFRDLYPRFQLLNTCVLGVSRDSLKSHTNFRCKYALPFGLISDSEETLCQYFNVLKPKSLYGRKYIGIERSTFLIDQQGILRQEWRDVKPSGHAAEVLKAVTALQV